MKYIFRLGVRMLRLSNFGVSKSSDFPFKTSRRETPELWRDIYRVSADVSRDPISLDQRPSRFRKGTLELSVAYITLSRKLLAFCESAELTADGNDSRTAKVPGRDGTGGGKNKRIVRPCICFSERMQTTRPRRRTTTPPADDVRSTKPPLRLARRLLSVNCFIFNPGRFSKQ